MKIFLDANILFSAVLPGSRTGKFLTVVLKRAEIVTSAYAVEEARRNLAGHKPVTLDELRRLAYAMPLVNGTAMLPDLALPAKDRPILAAAIAAGCTHLLTGDFKHFGPLLGQSIGGVRVTSMRLLAEEFIANGWVTKE